MLCLVNLNTGVLVLGHLLLESVLVNQDVSRRCFIALVLISKVPELLVHSGDFVFVSVFSELVRCQVRNTVVQQGELLLDHVAHHVLVEKLRTHACVHGLELVEPAQIALEF